VRGRDNWRSFGDYVNRKSTRDEHCGFASIAPEPNKRAGSSVNNRDAWFVVGLIFIAILASFAPRIAGTLVVLVAVYLGIGPLYKQFFQGQ
jgi:hypothetical protein